MLFLRAGQAAANKFLLPVYIFTLITLLISLIFQSFLLAGCTSPSPALRKFHLLSLSYLPDLPSDSPLATLLETATKASSLADNLSDSLDSLLGSDSPADTKNATTFQQLRIGYRGICVRAADDWHCAKHARDIFTADELARDPVDLLAVADIFKDKISFALPFWVSLALLGVTWVCALLALLRDQTPVKVPEVVARVGAAAGVLGVLCLCGALVLQTVTVGAVDTLVAKMGLGLVGAERGAAVGGFGWAAFALAVVGVAGYGLLVVKGVVERRAEEVERLVQEKAERKVSEMGVWGAAAGGDVEKGEAAGEKGGVRGVVGQFTEFKNSTPGKLVGKGIKGFYGARK